ncbi:hypothetical protein ACFYTS_13435 [Nocardia sp. NPDC004151]|uniref:hypothetical protein n=1 Tax=Nocardia sp. NPDC004151 TaxID=3364304 RepID=UPI00369E8CB3
MSEIDEIAQQTGRTFRDVLNVAGQWLRTLRGADGRAPKLNRKQRRELAEQIMAQVGAEKVNAAYYTKRVADYRSEHAIAQFQRENDPLHTDQDTAADTERLDAMRLRIEESLGTSALRIEHRGQVVMALDRAARAPYTMDASFNAVFTPMTDRDRREARVAAVESEQWVSARTQEWDRRVASMTVDQPARPTQAPQLDQPQPPAPRSVSPVAQEVAIDQDFARANAIQQIRHVQYTWLHDKASGRARDPYGEIARRQAAEQAQRAGMTTEQVRWEFANAEANSRCQVSLTASSPDGSAQGMRGYFATEAEAAAWTHDTVRFNQWTPGTSLAVRARETGRRHPFYIAEGNQIDIGASVEDWHRDLNPDKAQPPDKDRKVEKTGTGTGSDDLERRVSMLQRGLDAVTADRDYHKKDLESVRGQLDTVKNAQLGLNQELRDLRGDLDTARADRDRYRGERDEAVDKLRSVRHEQQPTNGADKPRPQMSR